MKTLFKQFIISTLIAISVISCSDDDDNVVITGIKITPRNPNVEVTGSFQLSSTILPEGTIDENIEWRSSDNDIVEVDETGLLTGINEGEAYIYAKTSNGIESRTLVTVVPKTFNAPKEIIGTWIGINIQLRSKGVVYNEKEIKDNWFSDKSPEEQDQLIHELRTLYQYNMKEGDKIDFGLLLDDGSYEFAPGYMIYKGSLLTTYLAVIDFSEFNIPDFEKRDFKVQEVVNDGKNLIIETPMGKNSMITTYEVCKSGADFCSSNISSLSLKEAIYRISE